MAFVPPQSTDVRIAIVTESFLPQVNGVTNSVVRVVDHLRATGHEALIIAPGRGPTEHAGMEVVRVPAVPLPVYRSFPIGIPGPAVGEALRRFAPDVVHLASPAALGAAGASAARRLGIPTVAVFQSDLPGFAARYGLGAISPMLWRWLRWVHSHADLTLAPSSSTAWELERNGIEPVARWARGVDTDAFSPDHRSEQLRRSLAPRGELLVGYVGRLAAEKQVHRLAPLASMRGVRVVVIGDGPGRRTLQRRMPRASFLGFRTGRDLSTLVASLDVFVHTGANETFCQAVQEALASGVPVVAPAAGGPLDLVAHGENGYLYPAEQPEAMHSAVAALRDEPLQRAAMRREARARVVNRTWTSVCGELVGYYEQLLGTALEESRAA